MMENDPGERKNGAGDDKGKDGHEDPASALKICFLLHLDGTD